MKKERTRRQRFEEEEARRRVIDEQETELQQAKQEAAIRKANLLLYEQNDKIKTFSSKLFLASVLDEREKQIELKQQRKAVQKLLDDRWSVVQAEDLRQAEEEEVIKQTRAQERALALKAAQVQQLAEIREVKIARRDDNIREGQQIKRRAIEAVEEEIELEKQRKLAQKERARDLVVANGENRKIREERLAREKEEEEKILQYAAIKEEQMQERKRRVDEKHQAKLERRHKLIEAQAELLQEIKNATEEREMRALRDFEKERREREEREEALRQERQREIDISRRMQLEKKRAARERDAIQKAHMQEVWRLHAERMIDEELDERQSARRKAEITQHILLLQAQEKKMQTLKEKEAEYKEGLLQQEALKREQEEYENYVNSVMQDYVTRGQGSELVQTAARRTKTLKSA